MSTAKRSRRRHTDGRIGSPHPAPKRVKTAKDSHVPARQQPSFLVDEIARNGRKLEARPTNGIRLPKTTRVDESRAGVVEALNEVGESPQNAIDISSAEESSSEEDEEAGEAAGRQVAVDRPVVNGHAQKADGEGSSERDAVPGAEDMEMEEPPQDDDELEERSFGEMLAARHPAAIDVASSFPQPHVDRQALVASSADQALSAPTGTTLKYVLAQALKTNDKQLLEQCFQTTDLNDIRATIERLQSFHVATLLQRLAERIHKRPGRTGNLITWVQWSLVAHGAYLASQPEVMQKLRALSQVLRERASGLQPLLHLKGKLDMLSAQLELRQRMQAASRAAEAGEGDGEEGVVYVEGQDDDWSDSEAEAAENEKVDSTMLEPSILKPQAKPQIATPKSNASDSEDSDEENMPNGVVQEGDDSEEDEDEGMFDVEAEEAEDDDSEEDSENEGESDAQSEDDDSSEDDDDSENSGVRRPHPGTLNRRR